MQPVAEKWSEANIFVVEPTHLKNTIVKLDHFPGIGVKQIDQDNKYPFKMVMNPMVIFIPW